MRAADHRQMLETGAKIGATRITASGDDEFPIVAERMAEFCDLARDYGMAVDLEFMPFRKAQSLAHAVEIVTAVDRPNAFILVDALHFFRSSSSLAELSRVDPELLGTFQICDAPLEAPAADALATEARSRRLLPGTGGLPLWPLIDALPAGIPFGVELPIASQYPHLDAVQQAQLMLSSTREFLRARTAARPRSVAQ
jgi:sugar phosphate isomerase/epimerase